MENAAEIVIKSILLSVIMGMSCQAFFETVAAGRKFRHGWVEHTAVFAFTIGFVVIGVTKIPPYVLQPVRLVVVVAAAAQIYFRLPMVKNLILSVVFCGIYWIVSILFFALASVTPMVHYKELVSLLELILDVGYLCLMLVFRGKYRNRVGGLTQIGWGKFGFLALVGIVVSMAIAARPVEGGMGDYYARLLVMAGFSLVYVVSFYYMINTLEKESQMQELRMLHERTRIQMNLYDNMKKRYEQQRRYQHDYRNQLNCIQGMIGNGQTAEALAYISKLTGNILVSGMSVNTNHGVVNVVLNQKYQEACEKGILMTMAANDLSGLTMSEEDIVTLLGNLLDNAIEACGKLEENRVIRFKMVLEEGELVLSVTNPVKEAVQIRNHRVVTTKRDRFKHGIGLLNVDSVIKKNHGTGVLQCRDGWFSYTAVIPVISDEKGKGQEVFLGN